MPALGLELTSRAARLHGRPAAASSLSVVVYERPGMMTLKKVRPLRATPHCCVSQQQLRTGDWPALLPSRPALHPLRLQSSPRVIGRMRVRVADVTREGRVKDQWPLLEAQVCRGAAGDGVRARGMPAAVAPVSTALILPRPHRSCRIHWAFAPPPPARRPASATCPSSGTPCCWRSKVQQGIHSFCSASACPARELSIQGGVPLLELRARSIHLLFTFSSNLPVLYISLVLPLLQLWRPKRRCARAGKAGRGPRVTQPGAAAAAASLDRHVFLPRSLDCMLMT